MDGYEIILAASKSLNLDYIEWRVEMHCKLHTIKSMKDFEALECAWKQLENGKDMTAFQSYEWNRLLVEEFFHLRYNRLFAEIQCYVVTEDQKAVAILPVIIQKRSAKILWWGRKKGAYILGEGSWSDYLNFIYQEPNEEAWELILNNLPKPVFVTSLRSSAEMCHFLEDRGSMLSQQPSVFVPLMSDAAEYLASLSKSVRQNLRTATNRMNKAGLAYELRIEDGKLDAALANELVGMHYDRAKIKNQRNYKKNLHWISRNLRNSYKEYQNRQYNIIYHSMTGNASGVTVIVYLNGVPAGYMYGVRDSHAVRVMHNCIKEEYKFYSPMFIGAYDFICEEINNKRYNVTQIDFTRGNESYKFQLGGVELPINNYAIM